MACPIGVKTRDGFSLGSSLMHLALKFVALPCSRLPPNFHLHRPKPSHLNNHPHIDAFLRPLHLSLITSAEHCRVRARRRLPPSVSLSFPALSKRAVDL